MTDESQINGGSDGPAARKKLWKPIGITILSTFVLAFACCAGGGAISSTGMTSLSEGLLMLGVFSLFGFLISLVVAFVYLLVEMVRGMLNR